MIVVRCIETSKMYELSGDDDSFHHKQIYTISYFREMAGMYFNIHEEELTRLIAEAKLTGYTSTFKAHERAMKIRAESFELDRNSFMKLLKFKNKSSPSSSLMASTLREPIGYFYDELTKD